MIQCSHCQKTHEDNLRFCPHTGKLIAPERLFPPGTMLEEKYRLGRLIGEGGMSVVFEATHTMLDKQVAIKLLLPDFSQNDEMATRLLREARAASATGHRNIVMVTDAGRTKDGSLFLVMEYLKGRSLDQLIKKDQLSIARVADLVVQILAGLGAVHRKGVVHRDLKPNNIIVAYDEEGEETVKILDFGVSKLSSEEPVSALTTVGKVMGTPLYMAPEQARGDRDLDQRVDLYACGAILYTMLVGAPPIEAPNFNALIARILEGKITPPARRISAIPPALDRVVMKALVTDREQRYADASTFREALLPFCSKESVTTHVGLGSSAPADLELAPSGLHFSDMADPRQGRAATAGRSGEDRLKAATAKTVPAYELGTISMIIEQAAPPTAVLKTPSTGPATDARPAQVPKSDPSVPVSNRPAVDPPSADPPLLALGMPVHSIADESKQSPDDQPLELAERRRPQETSTVHGTLYDGPTRSWWRRHLHLLLIGLLIVGAAGTIWRYRFQLQRLWDGISGEAAIFLLVETVPRDADVYVDGVLQVTKPAELPRTDNYYIVRVEADGYRGETVRVAGTRTRSIKVRLRSASRRAGQSGP